jgi:hypothetical protein
MDTKNDLVRAANRILTTCYHGNPLERFDSVAEMFRKDTGFMRPGKDVAAASGLDDDYATRQAAFDSWWMLQWDNLAEAVAKAEKKQHEVG